MADEIVPNEFWQSLGQYVYAYINNDGTFLYIGKGNGNRAKQHIATKNYDIDDLYIIARNLERFNIDEKQDWQSFIIESLMITRYNPLDNRVSGHYKECFEMAKFSELFGVYKVNQNDNFEVLPGWYIDNYSKLKGRLNVVEIKSDQITLTATTREQIQPMLCVTAAGDVKSLRFAIWADGDKLSARLDQLYTFLESCGIIGKDVERVGSREIYEIIKNLTIDEALNIFDDFMS